MIKQIIDKYQEWERDTDGRRIGQVVRNIPALEHELEQEMEKRAVAFATYVHMADKPAIVHELYDRFKFEQWAEREGYSKTHMGWTKDEVMFISDEQLYSQFKQEAK